MKFTIVTSFYNGEAFIPVLYEKIKNQTYTNWEWIVTDDFSKDNTKEKLLQISDVDRKVKYVEQEFKKQMFYNPQIFCQNADIIMQADQDDWPLPKALEVYHYFFTKFPETIAITCAGNYFVEDTGNWMNFHSPDYSDKMNMTCGYLTYLRAWRNNPNLKYDFNPNNWMKYYYNDLAILCKLEELGKILNLPRSLYYYNYRYDSVSHKVYENPQEVVDEGSNLIEKILLERKNKNIDTINRYFESIHRESLCLMDHNLNNVNQQLKISYIDKNLDFKKSSILKELFFDHHLNINTLDGNEDYAVFVIRNLKELEESIPNFFSTIKKIQLVIWNQNENPDRDAIIQKISSMYPLYYQSAYHSIINLVR